jgi:hypothetical protein
MTWHLCGKWCGKSKTTIVHFHWSISNNNRNIDGANVFNAHKIFETKTFLPKTGNIYSVVLSFPNLALKYHSDISISKKITLALPTYIQIFHWKSWMMLKNVCKVKNARSKCGTFKYFHFKKRQIKFDKITNISLFIIISKIIFSKLCSFVKKKKDCLHDLGF